jgi:cobalt/nickel transport system permease protein
MTDIRGKIYAFYSLEQLAAGDSCIHRLHPLAKLLVTGCCLLCVASLGRYSFFALAPYVFYPAVVLALAEVPFGMVARRAAAVLPFCLFAGISNLIFDRAIVWRWGALALSGGALSLLTILLRAFLCAAAVLLPAAVTPLADLTGELRRLRVPWVLVTLLEMVYRYIGVLLEQAADMRAAYLLRRGAAQRIPLRDAGVLIGQLLLRSYDRANRIYSAMLCRGYRMQAPGTARRRFRAADWIYLIGCCGLMLAARAGAWQALLRLCGAAG